jgi:transcriptional regulator with XRE-family HTH domain
MKRKYENPFPYDKTNSELARETGISASHLSLIFAGKRSPSIATVRSLAKAVGLPAGELLFRLPPLVTQQKAGKKKASKRTSGSRQR